MKIFLDDTETNQFELISAYNKLKDCQHIELVDIEGDSIYLEIITERRFNTADLDKTVK